MGCFNQVTEEEAEKINEGNKIICYAGIMSNAEEVLAWHTYNLVKGGEKSEEQRRGKAGEAYTAVTLSDTLHVAATQVIMHPKVAIDPFTNRAKEPDFMVVDNAHQHSLTPEQRDGLEPLPPNSCLAVVDTKAYNVIFRSKRSGEQHDEWRMSQPSSRSLVNFTEFEKVVDKYHHLPELRSDAKLYIALPDNLLIIHPQIERDIHDLSSRVGLEVYAIPLGRYTGDIEKLAKANPQLGEHYPGYESFVGGPEDGE